MAIPYGRQTLDGRDFDAVAEVLRGDWLTQGPHVAKFEAAVAETCGAAYAVAYSSGTAALHGAAFAAGLGPGDELLTSALTFAASANCGAYVGATPTFADIDPATLNVNAETIGSAVTARTKAIVPVHFAGLPAPVAEIREAVGEEVVLIEDAAHALGAADSAGPIGACRHSDMCAFSFHPVKPITTAEGGMVTTNDEGLRDRLLSFRTHGFVRDPERLEREDGPWYSEQHDLGFNYRLSDVHSALGLSQLPRLGEFIERRNEIAARYREELDGNEVLDLAPAAPLGSLHGYHLFVIRHRKGAEARRRLYDGLREREIFTQVHYLPVHLHPYYRHTYGYGEGLCPEAERYYAQCLSLPCFPLLTEAQQDEVVAAVIELS